MKKCFLFFLCVFSVLVSEEISMNCKLAERVCQQAFNSISRIEKEKIFLKPDRVHFFQDKIYLEAMYGRAIALPAVFYCKNGLYIEANDLNIFNLWQCKECENWNHNWDHPTHCGVCGAPRPS